MTKSNAQKAREAAARAEAAEGKVTPDAEMNIAPFKHESELEDADHQFRIDPTATIVEEQAQEPPAERDTGWVGNHVIEEQPPVDNDHVEEGATPFTEEEVVANQPVNVDGVDNVPHTEAPPGTINPETADQPFEDPRPEVTDELAEDIEYYYEYTHGDIIGLIAAALEGKAQMWEDAAHAESFKGAANQQAMQAYRWAAGQVRELAGVVRSLPEGEMRRDGVADVEENEVVLDV